MSVTPATRFSEGDRVTSIHGHEHVGTVIEVGRFQDGAPMYHVRRDSDGFVWIGLWSTTLPISALS